MRQSEKNRLHARHTRGINIFREGFKKGRGNINPKSYVFFNCDECGHKGFHGRYCPKCGLEAMDWKKWFNE